MSYKKALGADMGASKCRYHDCPENHGLAHEDEQVTCPTCRADLGLPPLLLSGKGDNRG